jgi:hypothetical protein
MLTLTAEANLLFHIGRSHKQDAYILSSKAKATVTESLHLLFWSKSSATPFASKSRVIEIKIAIIKCNKNE